MTKFSIKGGVIINRDIARFAGHPVLAEDNKAAVGARLLIVTDSERWLDVSIGHTFPVRDQVWRLDSVELVGEDDYRITISRVS